MDGVSLILGTMFDETLVKDLSELLGKSLNFKDIEAIGGYLFKNRSYDLHAVAGVDAKVSISPLNAAKILVDEAESQGKLKDLFVFTIELDGSPLNGRVVELQGLENMLYRLTRSGQYYDFSSRKFIDVEDHRSLVSWGALRDGREYEVAIASIDICQNSELVKKYKTKIMEQVYYRLWEFLKAKLDMWEGRIWSWAGDGGILAFRGEENVPRAVSCCLEILASLPVFNMQPDKPIKEEICLRIALDFGPLKFFNDTGKIVSEVINYAAHLEKKGTRPSRLSISDEVHARLSPAMRKLFAEEMSFEGRTARSTA
ncbi:MAG: adenylate/guanylate cyclase domain-containing protein [Spirochaetia bacterium]|jgi:class 3 adenylate cyclase